MNSLYTISILGCQCDVEIRSENWISFLWMTLCSSTHLHLYFLQYNLLDNIWFSSNIYGLEYHIWDWLKSSNYLFYLLVQNSISKWETLFIPLRVHVDKSLVKEKRSVIEATLNTEVVMQPHYGLKWQDQNYKHLELNLLHLHLKYATSPTIFIKRINISLKWWYSSWYDMLLCFVFFFRN